ncbi:MAG: hypothetical protein EPN91_00745 [Salinibacterium sp.]|nr:MAG: hypothetical protein EPN91_00745 [Salinibacterium sp.]
MGLRDDVLAAKPSTPCLYQRIRSQLSPDDRAELDVLITDHGVALHAIATGLAKQSLKVSDDTLRKHRNGECPACH